MNHLSFLGFQTPNTFAAHKVSFPGTLEKVCVVLDKNDGHFFGIIKLIFGSQICYRNLPILLSKGFIASQKVLTISALIMAGYYTVILCQHKIWFACQ